MSSCGGGKLQARARLSAAVLAGAALALGQLVGFSGSAAPGSIHPVGRIDLGDCKPGVANAEAGVDSALGILAVVCQGSTAITLRTYSTRTLQPLANATINASTGGSVSNLARLAVDQVHHRVFAAFQSQTPAVPSDIFALSLAAMQPGTKTITPVLHISVSTLALASAAQAGAAGGSPLDPRNPVGPGADVAIVPTGLVYDAVDDSLYVTGANQPGGAGLQASTSVHGPGSQDVYLFRYSGTSARVQWVRQMGQCAYSAEFTTTNTKAIPSLRVDDPILPVHTRAGTSVYAGCLFSRAINPNVLSQIAQSVTPGVSGGSMLTYRFSLDASGFPVDTQTSYTLGRANSLTGLADPDSNRIFWMAEAFTQAGNKSSPPTSVVFDANRAVYDGAPSIAVPNDEAYGVAAGGGRFYAAGRIGFVVVDARADPPGQGIVVPGYSCATFGALFDPATRHLFVQPYTKCNDPTSAVGSYFLAYQDDLPQVAAPPPPDPDSYTSQMPEKPGVTTTQFSGHGEATGTQIRLVGGLSGLYDGATLSLAYVSPVSPIQPDYSTRQVGFATIRGVGLDGYQSSANARVVTVDDNTTNDVKNRSGGRATVVYKEIHCADPGTRTATETDSQDSSATVTCDSVNKTSTATSQSGPIGFVTYAQGANSPTQPLTTLPIFVAHSQTSSHVWLDPVKGLMSETHSIVRGVNVGGIVINMVEATSECAAHGHNRTASCTYSRTLIGVENPSGTPLAGGVCSQTFSPVQGTDTCQTLLAELNTIYPGILVFSTPRPDLRPDYLPGSPGGYVSVAEKEQYEHLQDNVLNYDNSSQVPGLDMLYVNDSVDGPSRLDLQLADVESESHYGIQPAPAEVPFDGGGSVVSDLTTTIAGSGTVTHHSAPLSLIQVIAVVAKRFFEGLTWLIRNPLTGLLIASFLSLLAAPLVTAWRRRALLLALSSGAR